MKTSMITTGDEAYERARRRLDSRKAKSLMSRAIGQAMTPIVKKARTNVKARLDTTESYKQIKKTTSKSRINKLLSRVGVPFDVRKEMGGDAQVGMVYLEEGEKGRRAFALRLWENGFTRQGQHFAARPWFRPAVDSSSAEFLRTVAQKLRKLTIREAEKR